MKQTLVFVSSSLAVVLGFGVFAGCGGTVRYHAHAGRATAADAGGDDRGGPFVGHDNAHAPQRKFRGAAVGNYNKGYVDGVSAAAFFNKGQPLTDQQVDRLIEIGRRQGDPTGLLALEGYPDGYRTGAKHANNPCAKQMTPEQVAHVRKAQGLPPVAEAKDDIARVDNAHASSRHSEKQQRRDAQREKRKRGALGRESAEAAAR